MKSENKLFLYFILLSVVFILFTTKYFNFEENLIYGGSDGRYYISISKSFPNFGNNIEYIKGERFLIPYIIGFLSKFTNVESFKFYQLFSIIFSIIFVYFFFKIFSELKIDINLKIVSTSLIVFNPYLIRYFLALPTTILDLIFIISSLIIILGLLKKNFLFVCVGFFISIAVRQNGLFFLISFLLVRLIFKKNSFFTINRLIYLTTIFLITYIMTTYYAINSAGFELENMKNTYYQTLFGIFIQDYNFEEFIQFIIFPFISFGSLIVFLYFKKFYKINFNYRNEIIIILSSVSILIIGIGIASGPFITGKNLVRLTNLCYPMIIILICMIIEIKKNIIINKFQIVVLSIFFVLWSLHPTYSKIEVFNNLKFLFSNPLIGPKSN